MRRVDRRTGRLDLKSEVQCVRWVRLPISVSVFISPRSNHSLDYDDYRLSVGLEKDLAGQSAQLATSALNTWTGKAALLAIIQ
jgi:hypothetical protein